MPSPLLSIIVPIYNEEKIAAAALPPIFDLPIDKEVIVIDDGSTDRTRAVLTELAGRYNFRLIDHPTNSGKGAAIRSGLKEARGEYLIVCDADREYGPADILKLLATAQAAPAGARLAVYGSRFLNKPPFSFHYLVNGFLTELTNLLFGSRLTDMETCFKLIPHAALADLRLKSRRFEIEAEITAQLLKAGYQIEEQPIRYDRRTYQEGKKIKPRDGLIAVYTLVRERFKKIKLYKKGRDHL